MSDNKQNHPQQEGQDYITVPQNHKPFWKQIHHSMIFWIFLFLMLIGILYYIVSINFILAPHP
jgi:hypothetical protein